MLFELESMTEHTVNKKGSDRHGDVYFEGTFAPVNNPIVTERIVRAFTIPQSAKDGKGNAVQSEATLDYYRGFIDDPKSFPKQVFQKITVELPPFNLKKKGTDEWLVNEDTKVTKVFTQLTFWSLLVEDETDRTKMVHYEDPKTKANQIVNQRGRFTDKPAQAEG